MEGMAHYGLWNPQSEMYNYNNPPHRNHLELMSVFGINTYFYAFFSVIPSGIMDKGSTTTD